ncbi:MAG TPA: hypothetical protein VGH21_03785 [Solirubrobacteraceae bacterium]|jgi:cell wall assembly regulator SMI1
MSALPDQPPLLDQVLLARYERLLRDLGLPLNESTRPGLSDAELAALADPLPFGLPLEARAWWGWRDGTYPGRPAWVFGPGRGCLSLSRAVEMHRRSRASAHEFASEPGLVGPRSDPDFMWRPGWLPILSDGQLKTAIDCDVAEGDPSPVSFVDFVTQPEEYAQEKARSFGELIGWWCLALECGAWRWDAERLQWRADAARLPADLQGSSLV